MHAVEWKLIAIINKNKFLKNKIDRNWRHPLIKNLKVIVLDYYKLIVFYTKEWRQ